MKIAILIMCHKNPEQVNLFLETMRHPQFAFFIHVDKKSDIVNDIIVRDDVIVVPEEKRVDIKWGQVSLVDATLALFLCAKERDDFDFYWLCSGQDFPIKPMSRITKWFEMHPENDFVDIYLSKNAGLKRDNHYDKRNALFYPQWMLGNSLWKRIAKRAYIDLTGGYNHTFKWARRNNTTGLLFFFGSEWICLTSRTFEWMKNYLSCHPEYYQYMQNCNCSDESFFQTLLMNSPYAENRMDYLHYIDWSEEKNSPKTLTFDDIDSITTSDKYMARKIDIDYDLKIVEALQKKVEEEQ